MKSLAKVTQNSIPVNKFDNDQVNQSLGTVKELKVLSPKLYGNGIFLQPHPDRLRRGVNGARHRVGMRK